jgi:hypothetical protein
MNSTATYGSKTLISTLQRSASIIKSTLKYPENHTFIVGNPNVEEKITKIIPVYSKLGPHFKNNSQKISRWIQKNQDKIIKKIETDGDIFISDISILDSSNKESLLKKGYIKINKEMRVKGDESITIIPFKDFYLEFKR